MCVFWGSNHLRMNEFATTFTVSLEMDPAKMAITIKLKYISETVITFHMLSGFLFLQYPSKSLTMGSRTNKKVTIPITLPKIRPMIIPGTPIFLPTKKPMNTGVVPQIKLNKSKSVTFNLYFFI